MRDRLHVPNQLTHTRPRFGSFVISGGDGHCKHEQPVANSRTSHPFEHGQVILRAGAMSFTPREIGVIVHSFIHSFVGSIDLSS